MQETMIRFRKDKGLSQEELAERVGKSRTSISNIESGKTFPRPSTAKKIADVLGMDIGKLYSEGGKK